MNQKVQIKLTGENGKYNYQVRDKPLPDNLNKFYFI